LDKSIKKMPKIIFYLASIVIISISFKVNALDPSKIHCVKKEMSDKHKAEIRYRVHYDSSHKSNPHAFGSHDSTDPKYDSSDVDYEDPGSNNTYCYPVQAFNNNITEGNPERLFDFRIDVKHAGDCKNWDLRYQHTERNSSGQVSAIHLREPSEYTYDDSTQTYALRHYHFGVHTHCKTRSRVYAN